MLFIFLALLRIKCYSSNNTIHIIHVNYPIWPVVVSEVKYNYHYSVSMMDHLLTSFALEIAADVLE